MGDLNGELNGGELRAASLMAFYTEMRNKKIIERGIADVYSCGAI